MAMGNDTNIDITFEDAEDHSAEVRSCFSLTTLENEPDWSIYNKSYSRNGANYSISYSERGYFDHGVAVYKIRKLAKELPHHPFTVSIHVFNDGSGGNYHDELGATYKYGTFEWRYYCDYEQEDKWDAPPQLVNSDEEQLFPTSDFIQDIAEDEKKKQQLRDREHLLKTGSIPNAKDKVFITTGLTVGEERIVQDAVERSGGVFKEKFVKGISYLVYNPDYGRETTKLRDAKALVAEGKPVKIITYAEFQQLLTSGQKSEAPGDGNHKTFKLDDSLSFVYPPGLVVSRTTNDDGTDTIEFKHGEYINEDGENAYRCTCTLAESSITFTGVPEDGKMPSEAEILRASANDRNTKFLVLPGEPSAMFLTKGVDGQLSESWEVNLLSMLTRPFGLFLRFIVDGTRMFNVFAIAIAADEEAYNALFDGMLEVARSIRIHGAPLSLGGLTSKVLAAALMPSFDGAEQAEDVTSKLKIVLSTSTTTKTVTSVTGESYDFSVAEVDASRKRLLTRKPKKTDSPNRFALALIPMYGPESPYKGIQLYYHKFKKPPYEDKRTELVNTANELVELFRDDSIESDRESELRQGLIRSAYTYHAFRSFVWTSVEYCKQHKEKLEDFDLVKSRALAQFIFDRGGANYEICNKKTKRIGAGLLTKSEKDHGFSDVSYELMIDSLCAFIPVMQNLVDYLCECNRCGNLSNADNTLMDIFAGWCAFALACNEEFDVKSGPEDYVPTRCRELPKETAELTVIDGHYYLIGSTCIACTESDGIIEFPEGVKNVFIPKEYDTISGSREYYHESKAIIFPSSYTPGMISLPTCVQLVEFNGSFDEIWIYIKESGKSKLRRIVFNGSADRVYEIRDLPLLSEVFLPEDLKRIEWNAFRNTPRLKELRIPPNVEEIEDGAFKDDKGNPKVLLVDKGSKAESVVKAFVAGRSDLTYRVLLSPEQQKQLEEEIRLKRLASDLKQKLSAAYRSDLTSERFDALKAELAATISAVCNRVDWCAIREMNLQPIPISLAATAIYKVEGAESAEAAYDSLPVWIASDYIAYAEKKAAERARLADLTEKHNRTIAALNAEAAALNEELSHLGIFKGKRKKEIATLLEDIAARIKHAEEEYEFDRKNFDSNIE